MRKIRKTIKIIGLMFILTAIVLFITRRIVLGVIFLFLGYVFIKENMLIIRLIKSKPLKNVLTSVVSIILIIFIIEVTCYSLLLFKQQRDSSELTRIKYNDAFYTIYKGTFYTKYNDSFTIQDDIFGHRGIPNETSKVLKFYNNGTLIYNVTYTLDEFGRRKSEEKANKPHLILFGGSATFGGGLEDNETLSYFLSELTDYAVYNYGVSGYGTQHMLANLERDDFSREIPAKEGVAIYVYIDHHIRRVIGDMKVSGYDWGIEMPYYYLDKNNQIIRDGFFTTGRPVITRIYRILSKSIFFKYINLPTANKKHVYLTFKIIEKSRDIYKSKFNGTFYVLIHPESNDGEESKYLMELLKKNNIGVLSYPIEYGSQYFIPGDGHPNLELNKILAPMIVNDLSK